MRVLWFTNTPSRYKQESKGYNGGGWISSLEKHFSTIEEIELAVSFFHQDDVFKTFQDGIIYYPIALYNTPTKRLNHNLFYSRYDDIEVQKYLEVINDFKPDIIHVFGSEKSFGLVVKYVTVPVVIHIQGILNPYLNAWFPPGCSILDYYRYYGLKKLFVQLKNYRFFRYNAKREALILSLCRYFIGRTEWDRDVVGLYSPQSKYFYCGEILRDAFYSASPWALKESKKMVIVSVISRVDYKGFDVILKTAKWLKEVNQDFEWLVFGINDYKFWERKLGIKCSEVNVKLQGVAKPEELIDALINSSVYVHPSYIDNSPNSLCEAQLLGMPVIATNVGGVSSLIEDGVSGVLVAANDPFSLAAKIVSLYANGDKAKLMGENARKLAITRHDRNTIAKDNISVYKSLISVDDVVEVS